MPHFIVEYTDNLAADADIPGLLRKVNAVLMAQDGVYPTGAIRSRAIRLAEYHVADGTVDDAFVHATLKIGAGRDPAVKKKTCDELFAMMKEHFAVLYAKRSLALSMELYEFDEAGTYKHNNIHALSERMKLEARLSSSFTVRTGGARRKAICQYGSVSIPGRTSHGATQF